MIRGDRGSLYGGDRNETGGRQIRYDTSGQMRFFKKRLERLPDFCKKVHEGSERFQRENNLAVENFQKITHC
jgi:hypothetical protein